MTPRGWTVNHQARSLVSQRVHDAEKPGYHAAPASVNKGVRDAKEPDYSTTPVNHFVRDDAKRGENSPTVGRYWGPEDDGFELQDEGMPSFGNTYSINTWDPKND